VVGANPGTARDFLFRKMSRLALRPTQPPNQHVLELFSQDVKRLMHFYIVLRSKMTGATPLLPLYAFMA